MSTKLTLKNVNVNQLIKVIEPALIVDQKITLNIDVTNGKIFGVAGGHDKYKFWSSELSTVCEDFEMSADFNKNFIVKIVIFNTKNLIATMKIIGEKINIDVNVESAFDVYESTYLKLFLDKLSVNFACAPVNVQQVDLTEDEKQEKIGEYGDTYKFNLPVEVLTRIKQLSLVQTIDQNMEHINLESSENGKLRVYNDVFDVEMDNIDVDGMPTRVFKTSIFQYIDNDNYDAIMSNMPSGIQKIVLLSKDRDIQFVCSLLVNSDSFVDEEEIAEDFDAFSNS